MTVEFDAAEYAKARPCVGPGYCCKKVPCGYGERSAETGWCVHLIPWPDDSLKAPRYRCGRFEYISAQPGAEWMPAFSAGCCSPMFNDARQRILIELRGRPSK